MGEHPQFPYLFRPYNLKGLELRNRVVISGHFAGWWVDKGLPSEEFAAYLEERAKNGVGLFVIGATSPEPGSGWMENISDAIIPRYRMMAEAGHRHDTKVFAQFCHPGFRPLPGHPISDAPAGASGADQPSYRGPDRPTPTKERLEQLIEAFARAATRAVEGGMDGLEIHSHESFLHAQMLNPLWNTREDEYGGSLENRLRFLIETLRAMRREVGNEIVIGVRLKLDDMLQRGMDAQEYIKAIQILEETRLLDYVNLTGGDGRMHHGPMPRPEGEWVSLVKNLRSQTRLSLMHAGRITTPELAEKVLRENTVDLVVMTKTHICDPHFTRKVWESRLEDIRYCTRCLQSCHGKMHLMTCVYNPLTSREAKWSTYKPIVTKKRVLVIGAGPAGMEAAVHASERGHEVTVWEKSDAIGGQILVGGSSPSRKNWLHIADFYTRQANKGLFKTVFRKEATPESILEHNPDVVILATGSRPNRLALQNGKPALTVHETLAGEADNAKKVVVLDREGFNRPIVVTDYLAAKGIAVQVITPLLSFSPQVEGMVVDEMYTRAKELGAEYLAGYDIAGWDSERVLRVRSVQTGEERTLEGIDAVVGAIGSASVNELAIGLRGKVAELYVIGDANLPQTVEHATYQGARIGREI